MTNVSEVVSVPLAPRDWSGVPRLILRATFLEFMHNTGWPERFDGVVSYVEPFDIDADFEVICEVSPSRAQRRNVMIPCNVCNVREKFLSGGYLLRRDGRLYIAGPQCGSKQWSQRLKLKAVEVRRSDEELRAENRLFFFLQSASELRHFCEELQPFALEADRAKRVLSRHAGELLSELISAGNDGGGLWLRSPSGVPRLFGNVQGVTFLKAGGHTFATRISRCLLRLRELRGGGDAEARVEALARDNQLKAKDIDSRRTWEEMQRLHKQLVSAQHFFSQRNWAGIDAWLQAPGSEFSGIRAQLSEGIGRLYDPGEGTEARLTVKRLSAETLPRLPKLTTPD